MKNAFAIALVLIVASIVPAQSQASAISKVGKVISAPVVHPKRSFKQVIGAVLFPAEGIADIAHVSFDALDKVTSKEEYFGPVHLLFHSADVVSAKADAGIEKAELFLFGSSN